MYIHSLRYTYLYICEIIGVGTNGCLVILIIVLPGVICTVQ